MSPRHLYVVDETVQWRYIWAVIEPLDTAPRVAAVGVIPGLALLTLRGILLWVVIPLAFLAWLLLLPWLHSRRVTVGQFLGWVDNNLIVALERSVLRPLFRSPPQRWIPAHEIERVNHRIGKLDLY